MEQRQTRYQVLTVTALDTLAANQNTEDFLRLDSGFNRITGISVQQIKDGGIPLNYSVGVRDDRKTWVDPVNIQNWLGNASVSPNQKYLEVNIPYSDGFKFYAAIINNAVLTDDLTIEVTLRLVSDLVEVNK